MNVLLFTLIASNLLVSNSVEIIPVPNLCSNYTSPAKGYYIDP